MKDDLKKRFYDILFEPEEDEVVADAPLQDVRPRKTVVPHPIKASDVLYKQPEKPKPERPSPFINYEEKDIKPYGNRVEPEKPAEEEEETYTTSRKKSRPWKSMIRFSRSHPIPIWALSFLRSTALEAMTIWKILSVSP